MLLMTSKQGFEQYYYLLVDKGNWMNKNWYLDDISAGLYTEIIIGSQRRFMEL